jgi:uncharacterized protein YciI
MNQISILNPNDVAAIATGFMSKAEDVRHAVQSLIASNSYAASAAMVAGEFAILDAMTEQDKAFILRCKKEQKLLIEGGQSPVDGKIFSVVAEAASKQLRFPSREFSVWTNGTLYVKEDGFKRLLMIEGWSAIKTDVEPPHWVKLQDRSYWECKAWATAKRGNTTERVDCLVGVNGNASDGIEKILSHATRSILKRLYKTCSTIQIEFDGEDDSDTIDVSATQPEVKVIQQDQPKEQKPVQTDWPQTDWPQILDKILARIDDEAERDGFSGLWNAVQKAKTAKALDECVKEIEDWKPLHSERNIIELRRFFKFRKGQL